MKFRLTIDLEEGRPYYKIVRDSYKLYVIFILLDNKTISLYLRIISTDTSIPIYSFIQRNFKTKKELVEYLNKL